MDKIKLVLVTGLSGAGKTTFLKTAEDFGIYCVDNIPPALIPHLITIAKNNRKKAIAVVVDVRGGELLNDLQDLLPEIAQLTELFIVFLEASEPVLKERFTVSKRLHPIQKESGGGLDIRKAIKEEKRRLKFLKEKANYVINTTRLSLKGFKAKVLTLLEEIFHKEKFILNLISFGYKYGIPEDVDLLFDTRFLDNPYYNQKLRKYNGTQKPVIRFITAQKAADEFFGLVENTLSFYLKKVDKTSKNYLNVAFGCTSGFHRSVACVEVLKERLKKNPAISELDVEVKAFHRDVEKGY